MKIDDKFDEDMEVEEYVGGSGKKNKVMTMEDVVRDLKKDFAEEIADSKKYFCMSKTAEQAGRDEDSHYLLEMSKDEYTHAYFIHKFMEENDIHIPEEQMKEFEHLKEKMKKFF